MDSSTIRLTCAIFACGAAMGMFRSPTLVGSGTYAAATTLLVASAFGVHFGQRWSRWTAIIAGLLLMLLKLDRMDASQFGDWFMIIFCLVFCWCVYSTAITPTEIVFESFQKSMQTPKGQARFRKIEKQVANIKGWKILLSSQQHRETTAEELAGRLEEIFQLSFQILEDEELDPTDAAFLPQTHPFPLVHGREPRFLISIPPDLFEVFIILGEEQYVQVRFRGAAGKLAIENGYSWTARIAAALIDGPVHSVKVPDEGLEIRGQPGIAEALCSGSPIKRLRAMMTS